MSDNTLDAARSLDQSDPLAPFRAEFILPSNTSIDAHLVSSDRANEPCTYLCGNSLGPMSKRSQSWVNHEMERWSSLAVTGHFTPKDRGWVNQLEPIHPILSDIVGAKQSEVACMGTLTSNLHLLMNAFYKPSPTRFKILCEANAFPSDQYAFTSQVLQHGLDPKSAILELQPRPGEFTLREEDILDAIDQGGDSIALVLFSGVQYYTGQLFPMPTITHSAKAKGCVCAWDLAHAVGNVPLSLHEWNVDFAVWCSYKYLSAGPGAVGGLFIHEKWDKVKEFPKFAGWWGHTLDTRFQMPSTFSPIPGAQGWQQSNPSVLAIAALQGSLEIFRSAGGMAPLRAKSMKLTAYLESLLCKSKYHLLLSESIGHVGFKIITSSDPEKRGSQLSILIMGTELHRVLDGLQSRGVICDERHPDVIRLAPIPLYNTYEDCWRAATELDAVFDSISNNETS